MYLPAPIVGSITPTQFCALVATVAVLAISLVAMRLCCLREQQRRTRLDVFSRSIHEELAESGYRALFSSPVVLCVIVVILLREGGQVLPGLIAGGIAGLTAALGLPRRVVAVVRPGYFSKMDSATRRLHQEVMRRRRPALIVATVAPLIFAAMLAHGRLDPRYAHEPQQLEGIGFMLGMVQAGLLAWGVQYVQVLWSLQRDVVTQGPAKVR